MIIQLSYYEVLVTQSVSEESLNKCNRFEILRFPITRDWLFLPLNEGNY